jgi:hypothetical protein
MATTFYHEGAKNTKIKEATEARRRREERDQQLYRFAARDIDSAGGLRGNSSSCVSWVFVFS